MVWALTAVLVTTAGVACGGALDGDYRDEIANYYKVDASQVDEVAATGVAAEDVPVVFFIAQRGKTNPMTIAQARVRGDSWIGITKGRNLGADIYYMPIAGEITSSTYGPIFEKYSSTSPSQWRDLPLTDNEVRDMVNLKFISSRHDYNVFKVMKMRDEGSDYLSLNREVREAKEALLAERKAKRGGVATAGF